MNEEAYKKNNKPERGGQPGIYGHPFTSDKLHATNFPQADALIRQGWSWEAELPKHEALKEQATVSVSAVADLAAAKARVAELEGLVAQGRAQVQANQAIEEEANTAEAKATLEREAAAKEQSEAQTKSDAKVAEANKTVKESK